MFNAKNTQHINRLNEDAAFIPEVSMTIPFDVTHTPFSEDQSRNHSYFEDGQDPDELLSLPESIMREIAFLNTIRHTGLIIFEALPTHLKIHSYYVLLEPDQAEVFASSLNRIVAAIPDIKGLGVSGFMKMPYKNTREFTLNECAEEKFYPKDPRQALA